MDSTRIILALAVTQLVFAMSPGPNTILVLQSALQGRKFGLATVAGIWPISFFWAASGLAGLGALLRRVPDLGAVLSLLCGGYLIWLGIRAISRSFGRHDGATSAPLSASRSSSLGAVKAGAISNLTNPKTIAYFTSIFTATGASVLSQTDRLIVMVMMPTISLLWYGSLVIITSHAAIRDDLGRARKWLDRVAGLVMVGFGARLVSGLWRQWSKST